jgi:hypothetical protein
VAVAEMPGKPREMRQIMPRISTSGSGSITTSTSAAVIELERVAIAQQYRLGEHQRRSMCRSRRSVRRSAGGADRIQDDAVDRRAAACIDDTNDARIG